MVFKEATKSILITKEMIWEGYKEVKRNKGAAGVDAESLELFDQHYKLFQVL